MDDSTMTAVVTGVTSGIGRALTERLLATGTRVFGLARDPARLKELAARCGPLLRPVVADLVEPDSIDRALAELAEAAPAVDLLVNNAAHCLYEAPGQLPAPAWRTLLETNLLAPVALTRGLLPQMRHGSHIVNISSAVARHLPDPAYAPYALTKTAIEHYSRALMLELRTTGIRVSLIAPGLVDTPLYNGIEGFDRQRARLAEQIPAWLAPDDVAECVLWLTTRQPRVHVSEVVLLPTGQGR